MFEVHIPSVKTKTSVSRKELSMLYRQTPASAASSIYLSLAVFSAFCVFLLTVIGLKC